MVLKLTGDVQLAVPTLNANGTSKQQLLKQMTNVINQLDSAIAALREAAPHGRDYFTTHSLDSWASAAAEHRNRIKRITEVRDEISSIAEAVLQQPSPFGRQ